MSFDLRHEPWILARSHDGVAREYSLLEVFRNAHQLESIAGEVPTQSFAVLRLLLAVMYASLAPRQGVDTQEAWIELWEQETLPIAEIERYLGAAERDTRFDLLHPETPFYQVAQLHTSKNDVSGLERLVADVPNREQYFTTRRGASLAALSLAEAARWLVHVHAYDTSGIKSGAVGDERVKGGKGYPLGTGWLGEIGGLAMTGRTLRETLLLNLPFDNDGAALPVGVPAWDRPQLGPGVEGAGDRAPSGIADLYTWQSRRVRLVGEGDAITGVVLCYGDPLRPQNRHSLEMMSAWRHSEAQSKKAQQTVYMPVTHRADRLFWQGLSTLLPHAVTESTTLAAGVVAWVGNLAAGRVIDQESRFSIHATGMEYGTQSSVIDEIVDDQLSVVSSLLAKTDVRYAVAAVDMVDCTEQAVRALVGLAADLQVASGGEPDAARQRARDEAYFSLDAAFRAWLSELGTGDPERARVSWQKAARKIIKELAQAYLDEAGDAAWIGRDRRNSGHASSSEAREWFRRSLYKALPGAHVPSYLSPEGENVA